MKKSYLWIVLLLMLIFPSASVIIDHGYFNPNADIILLVGKWFVFWAVGIRLFTAGLKQAINPAFTASEIFHLQSAETHVIVKELGYANICMGALAILSLFIPGWRSAAAFTGGLYMGIAGVYHIFKKPEGANEVIAMVSDLFILAVMSLYLWSSFVC